MITGYFSLSGFLSLCVIIHFFLSAKEPPPTTDHCFFQGKKTAVNLSVLPSLPLLCSLLINWDFAWLNFKRPLEKTALLGCESLNLSSELWVFKSQGIMRLLNGEDKIQQCTNYSKKLEVMWSVLHGYKSIRVQLGSIKLTVIVNTRSICVRNVLRHILWSFISSSYYIVVCLADGQVDVSVWKCPSQLIRCVKGPQCSVDTNTLHFTKWWY